MTFIDIPTLIAVMLLGIILYVVASRRPTDDSLERRVEILEQRIERLYQAFELEDDQTPPDTSG